MVTPVANILRAKVGDSVEIEIEPRVVLAAAAIVYILPIVLFFTGYTIGIWVGRFLGVDPNLLGVAGAMIFLVLSYTSVRYLDKRARLSRRYEPKMISFF